MAGSSSGAAANVLVARPRLTNLLWTERPKT